MLNPFVTAAAATLGVVAGPAIVGGVVGALGFGAGGVVAGSWAAATQAGIGNVAAGSLFAVAQSVGAGGAVPAVVPAISGIASAIIGAFVR